MKAHEIIIGDLYLAKVNGRVVTVRVKDIRSGSFGWRDTTLYDVTNLSTGRTTTFRSPQKFRGAAPLAPERIEP